MFVDYLFFDTKLYLPIHFTYIYRKKTEMATLKSRKEISLDPQTITILKIQADKQGRKLKNYMEQILKEQANNFELTEEYQLMMDEKLREHERGNLHYFSEEEFKRLTVKK
jgi:3-isopropylmalate dehydratase small subunit